VRRSPRNNLCSSLPAGAALAAVLLVCLSASVPVLSAPATSDEDKADEKLLRDHGVATDPAGLLAFFRRRTPTDDDRRRTLALVERLGSERFADREAASRELVLRGAPVREALRKALAHPDLEVAQRAARCLDDIDSGPGAALPLAAARALARQPVADAVGVLLAYLPFTDEESIEEEVLAALLALHPKADRLDPTVTAALADPRPVLRAAAAHVAGRGSDAAGRDAVRKLLGDTDPRVRFRAARALLAAGERTAVAPLIEQLALAPPALAWQIEEVLYHLAGDKAPPVEAADGSPAVRHKARDAWAAWWEREGALIDIARVEERDRLLGLTLGIEYNTGRVWEAGPDGTVRWELTGLSGPMDAQVLPGGRVLIAESNGRRVSERDLAGNVLWEKKLDGEPTGVQRLPNGNTFVSTYGSVMEFRRDGSTAYSYPLGGGSNAIRRHRNGHVVYAGNGEVVELDTAGNRVRSVPIPKETMWVGIQDLPGDRFLLANSSTGRVVEVDGTGKLLWEGKVAGACGVARLPNGNTLVATSQRVVELDRQGKAIWEKRSGGYVRRVHRR
jgi:hypothetical protein